MFQSRKHIGILFSKPDYYINLENWKLQHNPILLISGLAGSGKTYLSNELGKEYNAEIISLDVLKFYNKANLFSRTVLDEFLSFYPDITPLVTKRWAKDDFENTNDQKYTKYSQIFFDFIYDKFNKNDTLLIVEGIQLFARISWSKSIGFPHIILRGSAIRCFYFAMRRYLRSERKEKTITQKLDECKLHHWHQLKQLDNFIEYIDKNNVESYQNLQSSR